MFTVFLKEEILYFLMPLLLLVNFISGLHLLLVLGQLPLKGLLVFF
jgi:hypothetical protein